jgi:hypothetical protein
LVKPYTPIGEHFSRNRTCTSINPDEALCYYETCMTRALFLSCSRRKSPEAELMPAIRRYEGPCFRVLRSYLRDAGENPLRIWILSAEHGLIRGQDPILPYDRIMTPTRADTLRPSVMATFAAALRTEPFQEACVCMGSTYARAMSHCWQFLSNSVQVYHTHGSIGGQASQLKAWLHLDKVSPDSELPSQLKVAKATILGIQIDLPTDEVLTIARQRLMADSKAAMRFQTRFVLIDQYRIAPKWLVAQLTGLPVSRFRTAEACRVLNALGLRVECV